MKILELRFQNLNSLHGEWMIDFRDDAFLENGIFAITGATGAGKTTILDAITLALFGATARLGKITETSNEIMSRHTGECFAEISFETKQGSFRVTWSQRRSRKQAEGKLQTPKHEIVNALTGEIIASTKLREVEKAVEDRLGMNFKQFTRSILLAQGSFAAFLQASPDERAPILEQITGTEIYTQISLKVHERRNEEKSKLLSLEDQVSNIKILTEDEQLAMQNLYSEKESLKDAIYQQHKDMQTELSKLKNEEAWLREKNKLETNLINLNKSLAENALELDSAKQKQVSFDSAYKIFSESKKGRLTSIQKLRELNFKIFEEEKVLAKSRLDLNNIKQDQQNLKQEKTQIEKFIATSSSKFEEFNSYFAKSLDLKTIEANISSLEALAKASCKLEQELDKEIKYKESLETKLIQARKEFKQLDQDSKTYEEKKASYIEKISGLEKKINDLLQGFNLEAFRERIELYSLMLELKQLEKSKCSSLESLDLFAKDLKIYAEKKELLEALCKELEKNREQELKILNLEEERKKLLAGEACPLCGSLEHPFVESNTEFEDSSSELSIKKQDLAELLEKQKQILLETAALEKEIEVFNNNIEQLTEKLENLSLVNDLLENLKNQSVKHLEDDLLDMKNKLKQIESFDLDLNSSNKLLRELDLKFASSAEQRNRIKENGLKLKSESELLGKRLVDSKEELKNTELEFVNTLKLIDASLEIDENISRTFQALKCNYVSLKEKKLEAEQLQLSIKEADLKVSSIDKSLGFTLEKLQAQESALNLSLKQLEELTSHRKSEFSESSPEALEAALEQEDLALQRQEKDLIQKINELENQRSLVKLEIDNISNRIKELESELESAKFIYLNELEQAIADLSHNLEVKFNELSELNQELGIIKEKLESNAQAKKNFAEKIQQLNMQKKELERFNLLHELIGSSDGKKFRNFAQGLSFEIMINQANRQLEKMTDRYLLIRDEKNNLALNILDNYQAGEIRSTKNLSGGESFIVSLALALGLSKMASNNIQVDSLFLDEGFGTLDEEALETAISVLSGLKEDGKLIGVISHIPALKERIPTQIHIEASSLGRSSIHGAGVKKTVVCT
ncbi:MAG: AAA family ATPase [Candidatus Caenarcaniphilales bacterium]|nr:AAA family ATPase [Candidatus Caenarcaniphilales bacterium]